MRQVHLILLIPLSAESRLRNNGQQQQQRLTDHRGPTPSLRDDDLRFYFRHFQIDSSSNLNSMPTSETPSPSVTPTKVPTSFPTTMLPSTDPTFEPTLSPSYFPTQSPSITPTVFPSNGPSRNPTSTPTFLPTVSSTTFSPTRLPSLLQSADPTVILTEFPSVEPTLPIPPSMKPTSQCRDDRTKFLIEETNEDIYINIDGDAGLSPGDVFVFGQSILETTGLPNGITSGQCVVLEDVNVTDNLYCTMNFDFPEGSIVLQGVFYKTTVVSGTDCYAGLHGKNSPSLRTNGFEHNITKDDGLSQYECPHQLLTTTWIESSGDTYVDSDRSGSVTPGDLFVFDSNRISMGDNGMIVGTVSGICIVMPRVNGITFCLISIENSTVGTLTAMGSFSSMTITGGTGCFVGISGVVQGESHPQGFAYSLSVDSQDVESAYLLQHCTVDIFDTTWIHRGEDVFIDHNGDGLESPGEMYLIDNRSVQTGLFVDGLAVGHCVLLGKDVSTTYCRINFSFPEGTVAAIGFIETMVIVGASGCFRPAAGGLMKGTIVDGTYSYTFELDRSYKSF